MINKLASNWRGKKIGQRRSEQTTEGSEDGEAVGTNAGIHGRHRLMQIVREPESKEDRGMANRSVHSVRKARTVETLILGRIVPGSGAVLLGD